MKNNSLFIACLALLFGAIAIAQSIPTDQEPQITWFEFEKGIAIAKQKEKKVFIDFYTDWCGWCKRMDQTTFKDQEVINFINEHFVAIKFNAEQKEDVVFKGKTYKFIDEGRRGYHELASFLLDKRLGYPSFAYLDEKQERMLFSPGYKQKDQLLAEMKQIIELKKED
jgi:thioredoxin-related protein